MIQILHSIHMYIYTERESCRICIINPIYLMKKRPPPWLERGHTMVIHDFEGKRIACAPISEVYAARAQLRFQVPLTVRGVRTVQYSTVQYSTVQYSTVQYSTVQYSTVQYSTVQYSTVQYSTVQYSTVQYSTVQYSTVQYSTAQYSTVQYSTVQYSTVQYSTVQYNGPQRSLILITECFVVARKMPPDLLVSLRVPVLLNAGFHRGRYLRHLLFLGTGNWERSSFPCRKP